jgi:hypothetical protein
MAGSTAPMAILSQYDSSDDESGDKDKGLDKEKAADGDIVFDGLDDEEQAKGGAGARAGGAAYPGPNEEAGATIERTKVKTTTDDEINEDIQAGKGGHEINKATAGEVEEDDEAGKGGHGLRHGMAGLEAAMAVPGSTATRFAEQARANRATAEEVATKHEAVCRSIVDDQAGALSEALGPKATERTYLAMLNAEGVFSVMHSLRWWAEAPGGPRCGRAQDSPTYVDSRSRMTTSSGSSPSLRYRLATRPDFTRMRQMTSTIVPRLSRTKKAWAGRRRAGDSSRSQSNRRPSFLITRRQAQPSAGLLT